MAIVINGSGTITGISAGGLPDGCIVDADINGMAASKLSGALPAISGASLTGLSSGITMADQWRITSNFSFATGVNVLNANWERVDTDGYGQLGTGMTESSGVFTFPSTGIYFVNFFTTHRQVNGNSMYNGIQFHVTTDNSSYIQLANAYDSVAQTAYFANTALSHIVDITNTSTHKIKFAHEAEQSSNIAGSTNQTETGVTFIRLGDT